MNIDALRGLYVITDDVLTPSNTLIEQVTLALEGGAKIVQLRDKISSIQQIKKTALELESLCKKHDAIFVLNDKVELAIELGISGLHIGKSDHYRIKQIRERFSGYLGVSCYADVVFAKQMQDIGIDYVAFGSFFNSPTKPNSNIIDLEVLTRAKEQLGIPVCAIGGINSDTIADVMQHKPDMVSLISGIWKCNDIKTQAEKISSLYKEQK